MSSSGPQMNCCSSTLMTYMTRTTHCARRAMPFVLAGSMILQCGCGAKPSTPQSHSANVTTSTPLILEKADGERRVLRGWPGHPTPGETFILKVDPKNGGSSHMVFFTAVIAPGGAIHAHRHPHADEILFFQTGTARVHLGDAVKDVHAGATVFIPAGTLISVDNLGKEDVSSITVFSAPGFEDFMRAGSVREGEIRLPLSKEENDQIEKAHLGDVIYEDP
jgi:quercetin dioxygenase-like cupin family protein